MDECVSTCSRQECQVCGLPSEQGPCKALTTRASRSYMEDVGEMPTVSQVRRAVGTPVKMHYALTQHAIFLLIKVAVLEPVLNGTSIHINADANSLFTEDVMGMKTGLINGIRVWHRATTRNIQFKTCP
ncbi:hypothetical protein CHS0354_007742 [Potamilus streckersoni]|uniref:Uncharacterized protein n=1 Tax=Potamilus streckersoni TaxID=2493646 RepID=A0AAE0VHW5_9BIVA|nr:hypothetical protein CHS0354_007742 [Potamilus streckersoni]